MQLDFKFYLFGFVITLLVLGFFLLLLTTLFSKKQQKSRAEKLKMQNEFQQSLIEAQVQTQEQTLTTISQEIHDNVGQVLSLAKLNLNMLNTDQMEGAVREKLGNTTALITKAIDDLKITISAKYVKRPDLLAYDLYGRPDLMWFVLQYNDILNINEDTD